MLYKTLSFDPKKSRMAALKMRNEFASGYFESNGGITTLSLAISLTTRLHNIFLDFLPGSR
jgi:hypothetical protein